MKPFSIFRTVAKTTKDLDKAMYAMNLAKKVPHLTKDFEASITRMAAAVDHTFFMGGLDGVDPNLVYSEGISSSVIQRTPLLHFAVRDSRWLPVIIPFLKIDDPTDITRGVIDTLTNLVLRMEGYVTSQISRKDLVPSTEWTKIAAELPNSRSTKKGNVWETKTFTYTQEDSARILETLEKMHP